MSRQKLVPLGAGPPVDEESDEDVDYFEDPNTERTSDDEDELFKRRKVGKNEESSSETVIPPFLLKPKSDKPKKLDFTGHSAGCTRGATRFVQLPKWQPKTRPKTSSVVTNAADGCVFNKKNSSDKWVDSIEDNTMATDNVRNVSTVPTGSYEEDHRWLKRLEELWGATSKKDIQSVTEMLEQIFTVVANPYVTALYLTECAKDYRSGKTYTLSMTVAKEFEKWTHKHAQEVTHCLDKEIKMAAFKVAVQGKLTHLDLLVKAFEMKHPGNSYFLAMVEPFLEKKKYKEAAQCIAKLGLQSHYDLRDICLPLLLQDKVNLVEMYVYQNRPEQEKLLQLLDWLVDDDTDIDDVIGCYKDVPDIKRDKLEHKPLNKLAVRLMKLYQIPDEMCPNITTRRSLKGMRYLLYKKYLEQTLSQDQFEELIQSAVAESAYLQEQLVDGLIDYFDITEACRWALFYQLPDDKMPSQVRWALFEDKVHLEEGFMPIKVKTMDDANAVGDDSAKSTYYRSTNLTSDMIRFVDNKADFEKCLEMVCLPKGIVGVDAEWRPSFGQTVSTRLSLMQLGTSDAAFLLDILALSDILQEDDWVRLARDFFNNKQVTKVGYGIHGDLQMFIRAFPFLQSRMQNLKSVIDLQIVHDFLRKTNPEIFEIRTQNESASLDGDPEEINGKDMKVIKKEDRGLSELVRLCFGKPLSKVEQVSDWERRPLRQPQIDYAALDATCLWEILQYLENRIEELGLQLNIRDEMQGRIVRPKSTKSERRQKRVQDRREMKQQLSQIQNPERVTGEPTPVSDFRVVVDNMLQGLGRQLRSCGADVVMLGNKERHDQAARIAQKENRVILTSGMPFMSLRSAVPLGMCYSVGPGTAKEQVQEVVEHFNISVTASDIFTRCQICNGNEYAFISPEEMKEAWHRKKALLTSSSQQITSQNNKTSSQAEDKALCDKTSPVQSRLDCDNRNTQMKSKSKHSIVENKASEPPTDKRVGNDLESVNVSLTDKVKELSISAMPPVSKGRGHGTSPCTERFMTWRPLGRGAVWQGDNDGGSLKARARGRGILTVPNLSNILTAKQPTHLQYSTTSASGSKNSSAEIDTGSGHTNENAIKSIIKESNEDLTTPKAENADEEMTLEDFLARGSDDDSRNESDTDSATSLDHIDMETVTIGNGVPVQIDSVAEAMLDNVKMFYVCRTCGKVFWEGSHFTKVKQQFSHVLDESSELSS